MEIVGNSFLPGDPRLIEHIVCQLKAQGIFDQFRKECIADVDTKPAYLNLRQRVEGNVLKFLSGQKWTSDMNKNQVREMLRKNIVESGFIDTGVERIVDQVVNPKIHNVFLPHVQNVVYKFLGVDKPTATKETVSKENVNIKPLKVENCKTDLPKDLEAVSPELETLKKVEEKKNDSSIDSEKMDDSKIEEDESPPFEPLEENILQMTQDENSVESHLSGISGLISHDSNHSESNKSKIDVSNQDSQFSKHSFGDGHLSIDSDKMDIEEDSSQSRMKWNESESKADSNFNLFAFDLNDSQNAIHIESKVHDDSSQNENNSIDNNEDQVEEIKEVDNEKIKHEEEKRNEKCKNVEKHKSRHKDKNEKEKDKSERDKNSIKECKDYKKEKNKSDKEKTTNGNSKIDKERSKYEKDKDSKQKSKSDKDYNDSDRKKEKSEKTKSSRDKSKEEKNKIKDKSKDVKDKIKGKEIEKKDRSSSGSKHKSEKTEEKDKSSCRHKNSYKDSDHKTKSKADVDDKYKKNKEKNSDQLIKEKYNKTDDSVHIKHKKDEKRDKSRDSKKKSSDDHYSSKDKKRDRRSTDRDSSDGKSGAHNTHTSSENFKKEKRNQESFNSGSGSGDSGTSDETETIRDHNEKNKESTVFKTTESDSSDAQVSDIPIKLIKPKFASNFHEAMRLMKIRKQLSKLEKQNQVNSYNKTNINNTKNESESIDNDVEIDNYNDNERNLTSDKSEVVEDVDELLPPPLADQVITKESWDALEAKLSQNNLLGFSESEDDKIGYRKEDRILQEDQSDVLDNTSTVSHFNKNSPPVKNNLIHLKASLEKIEHDIDLINSHFNKKRKVANNRDENIVEKKKNSNLKKVKNVHDNNKISNEASNFESKRGRKRRISNDGSCESYNDNNKSENNVGTAEVTTHVKNNSTIKPLDHLIENETKKLETPKSARRKNNTHSSAAKLQRYSSDDLYKPRLNFNSRRRSARTSEND